MVFRRARISRFIAAILAIALSTQIAGAQAVNCMKMSASHETGSHAGMTHHSAADGLKAGTGDSQTQMPGSTSCSQTMFCVNAPAMPIVTLRTVAVAHDAPPVAFAPAALEARALRPDSPPPKI